MNLQDRIFQVVISISIWVVALFIAIIAARAIVALVTRIVIDCPDLAWGIAIFAGFGLFLEASDRWIFRDRR